MPSLTYTSAASLIDRDGLINGTIMQPSKEIKTWQLIRSRAWHFNSTGAAPVVKDDSSVGCVRDVQRMHPELLAF